MSNFDPTAVEYRIGSVSTNAVKAIRELYGRDNLQFLDADTQAIKAIEAILHQLPVQSDYQHLEALPIVSSNQPKTNPALNDIRELIEKKISE